MSEPPRTSVPQSPARNRSPPPPHWNPFVTGLMILVGIPLLAPGFCVWMGVKLGSGDLAAFAMLFCLPGLALLGLGIRRLVVPPTQTPTSERIIGVFLVILAIPIVIIGIWVMHLLQIQWRN